MAYVVGGDADYSSSRRQDYSSRRPERVTYEEERVVRRVSGPRGSVGPSRTGSDDWDAPIKVKVIEDPKKEPGYVESTFKNGALWLGRAIGIAGFLGFWVGAFAAVGGSHSIMGLGHAHTFGYAPAALMVGGTAAMLTGGIMESYLKPKAK